MGSGANLAPFSLPKSTKILPKIDPKMHQIFDRFLHRFFLHFGSNLGPNLGPCWPLFRKKRGTAVKCSPLPCWVYVIFRFFRHLDPLLAQFGLDFGRVWASIWEVFGVHFGGFWSRFGSHVACNFGTFLSCSFLKLPLVLCGAGLVGLREALTILAILTPP